MWGAIIRKPKTAVRPRWGSLVVVRAGRLVIDAPSARVAFRAFSRSP